MEKGVNNNSKKFLKKNKSTNSVNARVKDSQQPKLPLIFSIGMFLAPIAWYGPAGSVRNTLVPQLFSNIDSAHKVWAVGIISAVATIAGAIANIVFGALSDVTHSSWGRRKPYILGGAIFVALSFFVIANLKSIIAIILIWIIAASAENAMAAAMYPEISDRIAPKWRGTVSTFYGVGFTIAQQAFIVLAAQFLGNIKLGFYVMGAITLVIGIAHIFLVKEKSNLDRPKVAITKKTFTKYFFFPTKGARDFYLALIGKFFMVVGTMMINTYQVYLFTDYLGLSKAGASGSISTYSTIMLVVGLIFCAISGPIADKFKRVKTIVVIGSFILGFAALFPLFAVQRWAMFVYAFIAAIGNGIYNSVDNALNIDVLPSSDTAGKDMGLLNLANTLSQALAALVGSALVAAAGGYRAIFVASLIFELIAAGFIFAIRAVK